MCTSIMASTRATKDGTILLSRNEDFPSNNCWNKYMVFRPQPEYIAEATNTSIVTKEKGLNYWILGNGMKVLVPEKAYSYNATPDAAGYEEAPRSIGDRFFFEERGINEKNVAISATNTLSMNAQATQCDPILSSGGVEESVITTLILPQVDTALEAVEKLGEYVETIGASSNPNGVLIGDPSECWYFEIGSGHHWIAVKIPKEAYFAVANGMRVHDVNLHNHKEVKYSQGLYDFVKSHGLLQSPSKTKFNFAKAFGVLDVPANNNRIWLAQKMLTPSHEQRDNLAQYPMFLEPDNKIEIADVMTVLRANYEGTSLQSSAKRPIGVPYTAESHIITLNHQMPKELRGMIWQCISSPLGSPYIPLFSIMDNIPDDFSKGNNKYDDASAFWAFKGLYVLASESMATNNHLEQSNFLGRLWAKFEAQAILEVEQLHHSLKQMYKKNPVGAIDFARSYSTGKACEALELARKEKNGLITYLTKMMAAK